jgi:hypothetical protein
VFAAPEDSYNFFQQRVNLAVLRRIGPMTEERNPSSTQFPTHHFEMTLSFFSCLTSVLAYSFANFPKSLE